MEFRNSRSAIYFLMHETKVATVPMIATTNHRDAVMPMAIAVEERGVAAPHLPDAGAVLLRAACQSARVARA